MSCTRREFLSGLSFLAGASICFDPARLLAATAALNNRYLIVGGPGQSVCAINLQSHSAHIAPVDFTPHGFAYNPAKPQHAWAIGKWGTHAAEIDFSRQKISHSLESPKDMEFFGHALFSPKGDVLYIVCEHLKTGIGHLIGYETKKFEPVLDYQVTPGGLHECHLLPDNTLLVASNGRPIRTYEEMPVKEKSSLVHVDLAHGQILNKQFIEDDDQYLGHFTTTQDGKVIALSTPRPKNPSHHGAIYFGKIGEPSLKRVEWPEEFDKGLRGEMLSIAVDDDKHVAVVTNPASQTLLFIDAQTGAFLGHMRQMATGISYDAALDGFICNGTYLCVAHDTLHDADIFGSRDMKGDEVQGPFNSAHSLIATMES